MIPETPAVPAATDVPRPVPITFWGRDHWSTLAYLETLAVDHKGIATPARNKMRCSAERRPGLVGWTVGGLLDGGRYATRLKGANGEPEWENRRELADHDDWDCVEDAVAAGLLIEGGTGIHPHYQFTSLGLRVAGELRAHKANGGQFHNFVPTMEKQA